MNRERQENLRMKNFHARRNEPARKPEATALEMFIARKADIDKMLARLQEASANHFDVSPDEVHYGHVGDLTDYRRTLRELTDRIFGEGEYAL